MWVFPGPGLEPVSPTMAGGFLTTEPRRKPSPLISDGSYFTSSKALGNKGRRRNGAQVGSSKLRLESPTRPLGGDRHSLIGSRSRSRRPLRSAAPVRLLDHEDAFPFISGASRPRGRWQGSWGAKGPPPTRPPSAQSPHPAASEAGSRPSRRLPGIPRAVIVLPPAEVPERF